MQSIEQLLHRIQWDSAFGAGSFALGYYDRVSREEVTIPFAAVHIEPERAVFTMLDADGHAIHIPLHRIRTVYRDGVAIWHRPGPTARGE